MAIPTFWLLFFFTLGQCDLPLFSLVPFYRALAHRTIQFIRHSFLLHCFHLSSIRTCDGPLAITLALPTPRTLSTSLLCLPSRPAALTKLTCTCESKVLLLLCVLVLLVSRFLPHPAFQNTLPQFQHASACSVPVYPLLLPFPPGLTSDTPLVMMCRHPPLLPRFRVCHTPATAAPFPGPLEEHSRDSVILVKCHHFFGSHLLPHHF